MNKAGDLAPQARRQEHIRVFHTLLETVCDTMVDQSWRWWCLDNIHHPLREIRALSLTEADRKETIRLEAELRILSHYFLK